MTSQMANGRLSWRTGERANGRTGVRTESPSPQLFLDYVDNACLHYIIRVRYTVLL